MDPRQSGFDPLKLGITTVAICGFLLCVIPSNVAVVPTSSPASTALDSDVGIALGDVIALSEGALFGHENVCWSCGCFDAAREIRRNMDRSVEPCTDFYKFACGSFIERTIIPEGEGEVGTLTIVQSNVNADIISMIEGDNELDEPVSFQLVKKLYKSCTNTTEDREIEHVKEILKKLGGWPMLEGDSWNDTTFNWRRWMYEARKVGDSGKCFLSFQSSLNTAGTKKVIMIAQILGEADTLPTLRLNLLVQHKSTKIIPQLTDPPTEPEFWKKGFFPTYNTESLNKYSIFLTVVAQIFGVNQNRARTETEELFNFAAELVKIIVPPSRELDDEFHFNGTLLELKTAHPSVPWSEHIGNFLPPNMSLADDEVVMVKNPFYYTQLETLMSKTPKRVQANYAFWRVILGKMEYIYGRLRNLFNDMIIKKNVEPVPLWKVCLDDVTTSFLYSVNARYVKKYFSREMKNNATEMFENIKQQLIITLEKATWLTEATRMSALDKAAAITSDIGYNDTQVDDNMVEKRYRGMQFTEDNYLGNKFNQESVILADESEALRGSANPIVPSKIDEFLTIVDAGIDFLTLNIVVPAAILRNSIYNIDQPMYLNYGAAGYIMGHELIHSFDDENINYDENDQESLWFDTISRNEFIERTQCLIDQYANYTGDRSKVFGRDYFGEHISDNGGIKLAYRAYKNWVAKNREEKKLPGLTDYTPRQMFWIGYANYYCSKSSEEYLSSQLANDPHAPRRYRVIGTLSNMPEFAEDFGCSNKSALANNSIPFAMVPEKRCSVW